MPIANTDLIEVRANGKVVFESFATACQWRNAALTAGQIGLTHAATRRHLLKLGHLGYLETEASDHWLPLNGSRFSGNPLAFVRLPHSMQRRLKTEYRRRSFSEIRYQYCWTSARVPSALIARSPIPLAGDHARARLSPGNGELSPAI